MENIQESLQKITLKEIAQTPFAYALYVVTIVLMGVIGGQRLDANSHLESCEAKILSLEATIKAERKEKDDVFKAFLVAKGINESIQKTVDSTAIQNYKQK